MIRQAEFYDISSIMNIIDGTLKDMHSYNNYQWDENYPKEEDFIKDIKKKELYVEEIDKNIAGFICINKAQTPEYKQLTWSSHEEAIVIHRMAVATSYRRKGIGTKLMNFAEDLAKQQNIYYIKTDTNSLNVKMNNLFKKFSYNFIGEVNFPRKETPFYCYDKMLK